MKRLTRKELDEIRRVYHMDLPKTGCQRYDEKTGSVYACHIYIEKLVNEIEALWRARKKKVQMSRKLTKTEKMLGRSENYHSMSAESQWAEDKRLGIVHLDWDGTKEKAKKILKSKGQAGSRNGAKTVVRLLRAGDIIQKGDEYKLDMPNAEWLPVPDQYWNLRYSRASFRSMRRPSVNRRLV